MIQSDRPIKIWVKIPLLVVMMFLTSDLEGKEERDYQGLPPGEGIDLVLENCTACHSADIIRKNHMNREAWDKTITWMQEKQGLWKLGKDRKIILDYLSKTQGLEKSKTGRREGNPMYEFDYRANPF